MTATQYPHPKDSWSVVNVRGEWVAVKSVRGIQTEDAAKAQAAKKNAAAVRNRARFAR
jgi:hypothetical protein